MTLTNGDEQTYGVPLGIVPSDTKVYDFSTDALVSGKTNVTVYNSMGKTDSLIEAGGTATGTAGSFLSIASDPTDATNKVLKNYVAESGTASFITLNPYVEVEGGKFFVFDFDHYYEAEGDSGWGGIDYFIVNHSDFSTVCPRFPHGRLHG